MAKWERKELNESNDLPYLDSFSCEEDKLVLKCSFKNFEKTIHFDDYISFRTIEEGRAFKTLGEQEFDGKCWLFTTDESNFIDWYNNESCDIHKDELYEFIAVTKHQILEVLSLSPPEIILLD